MIIIFCRVEQNNKVGGLTFGWNKKQIRSLNISTESFNDQCVSCVSYIAASINLCGEWPDELPPKPPIQELSSSSSIEYQKELLDYQEKYCKIKNPNEFNKIRFDDQETDTVERLYGNTRQILTGGHGNVSDTRRAVGISSQGSFNMMGSSMYGEKQNVEYSDKNSVSTLVNTGSGRTRPLF